MTVVDRFAQNKSGALARLPRIRHRYHPTACSRRTQFIACPTALAAQSKATNLPSVSTQAPHMASNLPVQSASAQTAQNYTFPRHRLRLSQTDPSKTPLVLVACGSFSPITYLHLRMFEMAADYVKFNKPEFELMGGYLSPVSDLYKKAGLASSAHRYVLFSLIGDFSDTTWAPNV